MKREIAERRSNPLFIVLSGPSGVGKDAVLARMRKAWGLCQYVVTVTTRPKREEEVDGVDYCFLPRARFDGMVEGGELLEWAQVYGNWYGVPRRQIQEALARGCDIMAKVDVQGAATIKRKVPEAVFIFLAPPSMEELEMRLRERKSESIADLRLRMAEARREMECLPMFDYVVVNHQDRMDQAVTKIEAIITAEKCRVRPRQVMV